MVNAQYKAHLNKKLYYSTEKSIEEITLCEWNIIEWPPSYIV